jgi:hypothetical protein
LYFLKFLTISPHSFNKFHFKKETKQQLQVEHLNFKFFVSTFTFQKKKIHYLSFLVIKRRWLIELRIFAFYFKREKFTCHSHSTNFLPLKNFNFFSQFFCGSRCLRFTACLVFNDNFLFYAESSSKQEKPTTMTMTSCECGDCSSLPHRTTKQLNHKQKTTSRSIARLTFLSLTKTDSLQSSSEKTLN